MSFFNDDKNKNTWYDIVLDRINNEKGVKKYYFFIYKRLMVILTNNNQIIFASRQEKNQSIVNTTTIDIENIMDANFIVNSVNKVNRNYLNIMYLQFKETQDIQNIQMELITLDKIYRFTLKDFDSKEFDQLKIIATYLKKKIEKNEF